MDDSLPRYDPAQTYRWNYDHAPEAVERHVPTVGGDFDFCGLPVDSPIGIAAGPLLNGKWCLYYAALGFDVVTYKTVRSAARECYPLPNLQPVACEQLIGTEPRVPTSEKMQGSWAVSFGMPSSDPKIWRRDIERTRKQLPERKILSVSVVGTIQDGWSMKELGDDYARCARWAIESGADCIETNFSCPNVSTCDGQLYQDPAQSQMIARAIRDRIASAPFIIKIGHLPSEDETKAFIRAIAPYADALAMTNSIATTVGLSDENDLLFDGEKRGICGDAIRDASIAQTARFRALIDQESVDLKLIGVGGISSAEDVKSYLDVGAHACHLATAPMIDPMIGLKIREQLLS